MRSNLSVQVLEKKLKYLRTFMKTEGKYLDKVGMKMINKQLNQVKKDLQEAKNRNVIGLDSELREVYIAPSAIEGIEGDCVYITGLPLVWSVSDLALKKDREITLTLEEGKVTRFICKKDVDAS